MSVRETNLNELDSGPALDGALVVLFESRMAAQLADLVRKHGGTPIPAPALREIPIEENDEARRFLEGLERRCHDIVIFETGVGVRYLVEGYPAEDWPRLLSSVTVIARGPKPASALRALGVSIDFQVAEPNTWRETLELIDERVPVSELRVAVQEYGKPNQRLIEGLEERGAIVTRVPVYRWGLPLDLEPLRGALQAIAEERVDAVLFTAAQQVEHVIGVAAEMGIEGRIRSALGRSVLIGSIGPTTSETIRELGLEVDIEPNHPKSGHLVAALAAGFRVGPKRSIRLGTL